MKQLEFTIFSLTIRVAPTETIVVELKPRSRECEPIRIIQTTTVVLKLELGR